MKAFGALILVIGLSACASDVANRYYGGASPERPASEVQILSQAPSRHYTVIADFQSRRETAEDMRSKAAKLGADAVIVAYLGGKYSTSEEWADKDRQHDTYAHIVGTAIKFTN
jgi:uncharacterized protein YbjQ (UPF0145 family)